MKHINPRLLAGTALVAPELKDANDPVAILAEVKKVADTFHSTFEEYKKANDERLKEIEKKGTATPETETKLKKIEADLAAVEPLNQKLVALEAAQKAAKDATDELQLKIQRVGVGVASQDEKKAALKKRANDWCRAVVSAQTMGIANLSADQQKILADVAAEMKANALLPDTAGGYLAPTEYVLEIIKGETEISPARSLVRVRQTANKSIQIPKRTGQFAAQWVAEEGTKSETTGLTYGLEEIQAHEIYALIDITNQMLEDSAFDMEAEIRTEAQEQFAVAEGAAVVSGNGVGKPEGFLSNANVATTNSGHATLITADGLLTLFYAIKTAYSRNATWSLNRTTLGSTRKLKDGNGQYLWMPGLAQGQPNSINGAPYVEMPDMPNEGAGLKPVAFGDFRRAYTLVDRIAIEMLRDPYTQATTGKVRFILRRRIGGQVTLAEAIRTLTCSA